jgi:hypothetical protein
MMIYVWFLKSPQFQRVLWGYSLAIFATIFVENARLFQLFKHLKKAAKGIYKMRQM